MPRTCTYCGFGHKYGDEEPCVSCDEYFSNWKPLATDEMKANIQKIMSTLKEITPEVIKENNWEKVLANTEVQIWLASGGDEDTLRHNFDEIWKEETELNLSEKRQCKDCGYLGHKFKCKACRGGFGWICKADTKGQHVNEEMAACGDFTQKTKGGT